MSQLISLSIALLVPLERAQARWQTPIEAGEVVERYSIHTEVLANGGYKQRYEYTVRVQSEEAKQSAGLLALDYDSAIDKLEILKAYTQNGKDQIPVDPSAIEDRDKGESRDYDVIRVKRIVFPQVQVGSRVHVVYEVTNEKPVMPGRWSQVISPGPGTFVEKFTYTVNSKTLPLYTEIQDPDGLIEVKKKTAHSLEFQNRRKIPGWVHAEKDEFFHPDRIIKISISTHQDAKEYFKDLSAGFEKEITAPLPPRVRDYVQRAKKLKSNEERMLSVMERMSEDFRYFGDWRRHEGALLPRSLKEIESSRYGDCKDLALTLAATLRALNIPARVAIVYRGENPWGVEPDYKLPAVGRFNHAIVRAVADGKTYWLDPTNPVASLRPYLDITGRPAFVLGENYDRIPETTSDDHKQVLNVDYHFLPRTLVRVNVDVRFHDRKAFSVANNLLTLPRSQLLSEAIEAFSEGNELNTYDFVKEPKVQRRLPPYIDLGLTYETNQIAYTSGDNLFFVIPDGILMGAFFETTGRVADIRLDEGPSVYESNRRLKKVRLKQAAPGRCQIRSPWMDLDRTVEVLDDDVMIRQRMDLKRSVIRQSEFGKEDFIRLQNEARRCFYRSGILLAPLKG